MKRFNRFKNSLKNSIVFGIFTVLSVGLGVAGIVTGTTPLLIGLSCASIALGGIWSVVSGISIKRAVVAKKNGAKTEETPDSGDSKSLAKQKEKTAYNTAKRDRTYAVKAAKQQYADTVNDENKNFKTQKETYKKSNKTPADKFNYSTATKEHKNNLSTAKDEKNATLKSIPRKPTGYKLARGFAIVGATLSTAVALLGGATMFSQYNTADTYANEAGATQAEFIDKQETTNNSLGLAIGGVALAGAIAGSVVAKKAKKRRRQEMSEFDYDSIINKKDKGEPTEETEG